MPYRLLIADPGNFHASLLQKEDLPDLARRVSVYAPLGPEILDYLNRVARFNSRDTNPTNWELDVHLSRDPMGELLRDRAGDIVVFAGRNRGKIDRILAALEAGMHVLADKPWILRPEELPKLDEALAVAGKTGRVAYDIMTERFEATSILQRVFVNDAEIFGSLEPGTPSEPGVRAHSVHHLMKVVAGVPLRRPAWFFDVAEYGEGLADVGTHVVDLVQWTAFPDQSIDYRAGVQVIETRRWPLRLTQSQFSQVTGEPRFPRQLERCIEQGRLEYFCNGAIHYVLRGIHVKLEVTWEWESATGDVYEAAFRGTEARAEIRQGAAENHVPELYLIPLSQASRDAIRKKVAALQTDWPGLGLAETGDEARIVIPEKFRVGHESHFAQVASRFFGFVKNPESMPDWERSGMLSKYYLSTQRP